MQQSEMDDRFDRIMESLKMYESLLKFVMEKHPETIKEWKELRY